MLTLYDLEKILNECKEELCTLGFLEVKNKNYNIQINPKFRKKLGTCSYNKKSLFYTISINENFIKLCPDKVKNTIMHELIHSVHGCMNHGPSFKYLASLVNNKFGYNITRTSYYQEYEEYINNTKQYRYKVKCNSCGSEWLYQKAGNVIKNIQKNPYSCTCPKCHKKTFTIIYL